MFFNGFSYLAILLSFCFARFVLWVIQEYYKLEKGCGNVEGDLAFKFHMLTDFF